MVSPHREFIKHDLLAGVPVGTLLRCPACGGRYTCGVLVDVVLCRGADGPRDGVRDLGPMPGSPELWLYRARPAGPPGRRSVAPDTGSRSR
jgi:hypothetical protein